ncbi:MAG: hypothetical protein V4695_08600 [Pseudomonadota bacterium]
MPAVNSIFVTLHPGASGAMPPMAIAILPDTNCGSLPEPAGSGAPYAARDAGTGNAAASSSIATPTLASASAAQSVSTVTVAHATLQPLQEHVRRQRRCAVAAASFVTAGTVAVAGTLGLIGHTISRASALGADDMSPGELIGRFSGMILLTSVASGCISAGAKLACSVRANRNPWRSTELEPTVWVPDNPTPGTPIELHEIVLDAYGIGAGADAGADAAGIGTTTAQDAAASAQVPDNRPA